MKANELMIGDWVLYNPNVFIEDEYELPKDPYPTKISCGEDIDLAFEDCYSPIPITSEILEKNGFGYVENDANPYNAKILSHFYLGDECFCASMDLHISTYNDGVFWFSSPKLTLNGIRYLHQLQHALRLAGIDKEIEL